MSNHQGHVRTEHHRGIGTIEFHHPKGNSMPAHLLQELAKALTRAGHDPAVQVIVLRSAGERVFCSGASFDEITAITTPEEGKAFFLGFAQVINAMRKCPKFIIARVQGKCIGGGVGLAAAADYCIATAQADVKLSELAIGIGPFVVGPAVERKLGVSAFSQLAIDATAWRNAEWARKRGLYAETHPDAASMDESLDKLALSLMHAHPEAMAEMKKIFWKGTEDWDHLLEERAAVSGRLVVSDFAKAALAALKKSK
jgi:methylglutaconyl-CoA hydratase